MPDPFVMCQLCSPPERLPLDAMLGHVRVLHPERFETLRASGRLPDPSPDAPFTRPVMTGTAVCECGRILYPGDPYAERPVGVADGLPVLEIACVACGEGGGDG